MRITCNSRSVNRCCHSRQRAVRDNRAMPVLTLHNSLTRRREPLVPIDPAHIRMYACGPTVYDRAHIGNARPEVVNDVLVRLLRHLYPARHLRPQHHRRGRQDQRPRRRRRATHRRHHRANPGRLPPADIAALGVIPPDVEPRATGHIPEMIAIIERLIASGHAYPAEGHVLFAVASYPDYGTLSGRSPDELLAGARIDVAPFKRDPGRLRAVEAKHAGPARLGQPLGPRPPRLAHRVQCHGLALPRRKLRHPRRRRRPAVPAPRERTRPILLRLPRQPASPASGSTTACCGSKARK